MTSTGSNGSTGPSAPSLSRGDKTLILASASPRRSQLLAEAGYRFEVVPSSVDEAALAGSHADAAEYAGQLALAKARDVAGRFPNHLVIGADTVVDCDGRIIGKPADAADAERIVRRLFSGPHKVITGLAIVRRYDGLERMAIDTTIVHPRPMTAEQIAEHIRGGTWEGKAGAYAIQETGDAFVERLEGSLTNVVGLPMELLRRMLLDAGYQAK
jgi:septum formation protein